MPWFSKSRKRVLVLIPNGESQRVDDIAKSVVGEEAIDISTCHDAFGCLDLARKEKPDWALIHPSAATVENVSLPELIKAISPKTQVRILD